MTLARSTLVLAALLAAGAAQADDQTVLKAAAREPGAVVLQDGVVVRSMKDGKGPAPGAADVVRVQYRGTLTTGQEFDSSYSHGGPITFPLNRVIPCWTEGVQKMHVGGKAKL
ncbi:MAG TPA: FKBP-type peptidyl-prolyl cis-trans isomerase, partial [Burkholderiaceae bacterium]